MGIESPAAVASGRGRRVAIVAARFNAVIVDALLEGARGALLGAGVGAGDIRVTRVPGAFEIPVVVQRVLMRARVDGVIALGAVIRGGTPHFEYVSRAVTDGCMRASLDHGRPVAFGVLTCDDLAQATARSRPGPGNKGVEAAQALLDALQALAELG